MKNLLYLLSMYRLRSILLLLLCLVYTPFRGGPSRLHSKGSYSRFLIWQNAKLGDMVCTTPLIHTLATRLSSQVSRPHIAVIGSRLNGEVLSGNTDVREYIVKSRSLYDNIRLVKKSKSEAALLCQPDFDSLCVLYLAGVPVIVSPTVTNGRSPLETYAYRLLKKFVVSVPHQMGSYAPREYLRLLEPFGIFDSNTTKHLSFDGERNILSSKELSVGIAPGAGNKIKSWPAERFADVADYLADKYSAAVYIFGGPNDLSEIDTMIKRMRTKPAGVFSDISINDLKKRISALDMFVSVDTGPIYLAEAFGVATIDITGPIDENEQPPIGELHRVVVPKDRVKPELFVLNAKAYNYTEARRQVESISVDQVIFEIDVLITILMKSRNI